MTSMIEVGPAHRREPVAVALRPVVAAAHARAGDADDGAEDEVQAGDAERDVGDSGAVSSWRTPTRGTGALQPLRGGLRTVRTARQVKTSSTASPTAGSTAHSISIAPRCRGSAAVGRRDVPRRTAPNGG